VNTEPFHFGAVILAAGASARMGEPKQLLRLAGRTLLRRTVDAVFASPAWPVVVVLGAQMEAIRPEIARLPVLIVENREWAEGLASSIRAGVRVLDQFSMSLAAAILVPCDQPCLSPEALTRLCEARERGDPTIVAARYGRPEQGRGAGELGPPALFARCHFHELLELRGPGGARPLLARHAARLATVDLPELAADLDTPADYREFLARQPSSPGMET
jgi:molybdenum cofactor cytidylyltransferase